MECVTRSHQSDRQRQPFVPAAEWLGQTAPVLHRDEEVDTVFWIRKPHTDEKKLQRSQKQTRDVQMSAPQKQVVSHRPPHERTMRRGFWQTERSAVRRDVASHEQIPHRRSAGGERALSCASRLCFFLCASVCLCLFVDRPVLWRAVVCVCVCAFERLGSSNIPLCTDTV
jgi:hypothetical protein